MVCAQEKDHVRTTLQRLKRSHNNGVVRLTGALSNLDVSDSLDAAVGGKRGIAVPVPTRSSRPRLRPRLGAIQGTILNVLDEAGRAVGAREVRDLVETRLQQPVSLDTVSSFLSVASRAPRPAVHKVKRGLYRSQSSSAAGVQT